METVFPDSQANAFLTTPHSETKILQFSYPEKEAYMQENVVT